MALSVKELKRRGVPADDIQLAHIVQDAQRRTGSPVNSIGQIISGRPPPATEPANLTERQLRKRGRYGAAALLTDQEALSEVDPDRSLKARHASAILKELAKKPVQMEFDFFKGNWSVADQYHDTIRDRIHALPLTAPKRTMAITVMAEIIRWLPWQDAACSKSAAEIADLLKVNVSDVSRAIAILESVGAIHRVQRGRTKLIYVNPEGAYRGRIDQHAATVDAYRKAVTEGDNVIQLRPTS